MSESDPTGESFGRYRLLRLIARGGMGEVHLARLDGAAGWQKRVAIKRILPHLADDAEFLARFVDEAKIAVTLAHGNIVSVTDFGEVNGEHYVAMDWVDGWDLRRVERELTARGERIPDGYALYIAAEICGALSYAHHRRDDAGRPLGIVHRDVSPSNILLSREGEVKLADFGIATARSKAGKTVTGQLKGKFGYMSPEQASGQPVDARSDVFALGVVLFEMLTGTRPFDGENDMETLARVQRAERPDIRALRPDLGGTAAAIVDRALSRELAGRYPDVDAMQVDLMAALFADTGPVTGKQLGQFLCGRMSRASDEVPARAGGGPGLDTLLNQQLAAAGGEERPAGGAKLRGALDTTADSPLVRAGSAPRAGAVEPRTITRTPAPPAVRPAESGSTPPVTVPAAPMGADPITATFTGPRAKRTWAAVLSIASVLVIAGIVLGGSLRPTLLRVETDPAGAEVELDGVAIGTTPYEGDVRAGPHRLRVTREGFAAQESTVDIIAHERNRLSLVLAEATEEETVRSVVFHSVPSGALVSVDDGGEFPAGNAFPVTIDREVSVRFTLEGHEPLEERHRFGEDELVFTRRLLRLAEEPEGEASGEPRATGDGEIEAGVPDAGAPDAPPGDGPERPGGAEHGRNGDARVRSERDAGGRDVPRDRPDEEPAGATEEGDPGVLVVLFRGEPAVGEIWIDGVTYGSNRSTAQELSLPPGRHEIRVRNDARGRADGGLVDVPVGGRETFTVDWQ